jgi:3alpha(or 20beta)-hydroxysteroid dehydrogenase
VSKFAMRGLTRSTAVELGPFGIRVNTVCPGIIRTAITDAVLEDREATLAAGLPMRRVGEPDDVADLVLFLVSDASRWITGSEHVIDGGSMA